MTDTLVHVYVQCHSGTYEWRQVKAQNLSQAVTLVESQVDVRRCLEASWIPGGVAT